VCHEHTLVPEHEMEGIPYTRPPLAPYFEEGTKDTKVSDFKVLKLRALSVLRGESIRTRSDLNSGVSSDAPCTSDLFCAYFAL